MVVPLKCARGMIKCHLPDRGTFVLREETTDETSEERYQQTVQRESLQKVNHEQLTDDQLSGQELLRRVMSSRLLQRHERSMGVSD